MKIARDVTVDALDIPRQLFVTVRLKNRHLMSLRLRTGGWLIRLGVWVAGLGGVDFIEDGK